MSAEPVLLPTNQGPIAGILGQPDGRPAATVLIVQGQGATRSGVNQTWTRLTRALNDEGIATLRADYSGTAESWDADPTERVAGVRSLVDWYRDRHGDVPLLLVASCYGLSPAAALARTHPGIVAVAVVTPPLFNGATPYGAAQVPRSRPGRLRRVSQLPRRVAYRLRYGPARARHFAQNEASDPSSDLRDLVMRTPTWIFAGSDDACLAPIRRLLPELQANGNVELEVAEGLGIYGAATPAAQAAFDRGLRAWVHRYLETAEIDA